jgi:dienelactone hydrolase
VPPEEPSERIHHYHAFAARHEEAVARSLFCLGFTFPGVVLAEDLAALGVLASRPEVDPDRLGCCGLSGGGLRTVYLAGMDDSLDCAVAVGFMSTWRDFALHKSFAHTWMLYAPLLPQYLDFPEILALRVPLPSLVLASEQDPLFGLEEARRADALLADVYTQAGAAEKARMSFYPGPHQFNRPMQEEAFAWMDRWLKG